NAPYLVVGVAPRGFEFPPGIQLWLPRVEGAAYDLTPEPRDALPLGSDFGWVGRLRRGANVEQARSELYSLLRQLNGKYTAKTGVIYGELIGVRPLREALARNVKPAMLALLVGAVLVLLVAGANCCMFLLGQAATRRREIAVRQAFGASRARVLRQMFTELLALGVTGGLLAFAISGWLLTTIQKLLPAFLVHPSQPLAASAHTFGYCLLLCILLSLLAGLVPALQCSSPASLEILKDYSGPLAGGRGPLLRRLMVVIEVSVAVVLVIGAILSVRTFLNLTEIDPGFSPRQVFMIHMAFPRSQFNDQEFLARQREILHTVKAAPGVSAVAADSVLPTTGPNGGEWVRHGNAYKFCLTTLVAGDYFRALKIPLMEGRPF
ncbi:MAG: FtsX-like permease family protein, partial [Terriglobia bacterium]